MRNLCVTFRVTINVTSIRFLYLTAVGAVPIRRPSVLCVVPVVPVVPVPKIVLRCATTVSHPVTKVPAMNGCRSEFHARTNWETPLRHPDWYKLLE